MTTDDVSIVLLSITMAAPQRPISPPEWDLILSYSQKNWPDKIVDLITNQGVDPNHSNAVGQTALHIASLWGHGTLIDGQRGRDRTLRARACESNLLVLSARF
jgi:Ankyrin repeats (many copies)